MPYTNGDGIYHNRRRCRRLHNTGGRIRRTDSDGLTPCEHCVETPHHDRDTTATDDSDGMHDGDIAQLIEAGVCPFCDDYEGDYVGQHASGAHPDEWAAYKS